MSISTGTGQTYYPIAGVADAGVLWIEPNGYHASALAASPDVAAWIAGGGVPAAAAAPSLAQQAEASISAGLTIALSGTITLAATLFPTDPATLQKIANVAATIGATGAFPGGVTTLPMKDASGTWHALTLAEWKIVAGAVASYAAALQLIIDGNPLGAVSLPSSNAGTLAT